MRKLTNPEIEIAEAKLGHELPGLYRKLLVEIGYGYLNREIEIYCPFDIRPRYEPFFDNPNELFNRYVPFGCHRTKQEVWVIDVARELAASISHEIVPDDWTDEGWLTYEQWILKHIDTGTEQGA